MRMLGRMSVAVTVALCFASCAQPEVKTNESTTQTDIPDEENYTETLSTSVEALGKILDFSEYKPIEVKFKYIFIDNSGQNERISVPGPSDHYLEAIMYFDSQTYRDMRDFEKDIEWQSQGLGKEEFIFEWLSIDVHKELMNSYEQYDGHPDFWFGTGKAGKLWCLKDKILLKWQTQ